MCVDVRKMCKKFERSLAIGMHWIMQGWRLKRASWRRCVSLRNIPLQTFVAAFQKLALALLYVPRAQMAKFPNVRKL